MRLLVAVFLIGVCHVCNTSCGHADDRTIDDAQSYRTIQRVRDALSDGLSSSALRELRGLPVEQRLGWLSELHQSGRTGNPNGGGSIADYTALIGLIESTIDADWVTNGGSASLAPFRQGVRIDPRGLIERVDPNTAALSLLKSPSAQSNPKTQIPLDPLGEWQQETSLRWVSLHQLDEQVAERLTDRVGSRANIAMELLGGLYRIDYLAYDKDAQEWFLGGPAGNLVANASHDLVNATTGLPPVLLEDVLAVGPHVLQGKGEFGCSIDPVPQRLTAAHDFARSSASARAMQRQPERWAEQWRKTLGRQQAKVVGLPQDSPTGYALLIADEHMKRLGLGLENCPSPVKTYWQEKEFYSSLNRETDSSMVRWWFALTDHKIPMDPDRKIYHFLSSNVQVLSEGQMMNANGERVTATSPDLAADAFAKRFTLNFDRMQREYPVYGRLRHIFDLAIALEIVRHEIRNGHGKPFRAIDNPDVQSRLPVAPSQVESIAASHRMPNGAVAVMISGGVAVNPSNLAKRFKVDPSQIKAVAFQSGNDRSGPASTEDSSTRGLSENENETKPKRDKSFWK